MSDLMRSVSFKELVKRIFSEYNKDKTIFSFSPSLNGPVKVPHGEMKLFGESAASPVGPAAGPHTQLAQNIISSWLAGARFFELKTVQIMDTLEIEKPCIDAEDEGFNTEWSTEYTLDKAYDEYLKGWFLCHILEVLFEDHTEKQFIFNMSIGYDLEGIKNPRMNEFIMRLVDSSGEKNFSLYRDELRKLADDPDFLKGTGLEDKKGRLTALADRISPRICRSVTLSTMHGCPPDEIEKIAEYLLREKKLNTFVKLNPTLLTFQGVRSTLDKLGFDYVGLKQESFDHDLQYPDAVSMLKRLRKLAAGENLTFGVKLTNTLGSVNNKGNLPGEEMYMSGRALFPISVQLALKLSREFEGSLPISFSGGASSLNMEDLLNTGIRPVTMATDMLKPGGYGRMARAVEKSYTVKTWNRDGIDIKALERLVEKALISPEYTKDWRGTDSISTEEPLPLYDCAIAPCKTACAIHQDIPEYIRLVGQGRYGEALDVIYNKNPLPFITGWICDHKCQYNCTRLDYDGSVKIRDMKKIAARQGWSEYIKAFKKPAEGTGAKVAVIGAGPAGLAAAYFLRRGGASVSVFEKEDSPGGVISHILPSFRMPMEEIDKDLEFIKAHGVDFHFSQKNITIDELKAQGFEKIIIGIGAEKDNKLKLDGGNVITSLDFLSSFRSKAEETEIGKYVAVVGGGNTAMDSARSAKRLPGVKEVRVFYRRTLTEMPADREEYYDAMEEGISFHFLRNPAEFTADGKINCTVMTLGEADASGRRRPVATEEIESFPVDTLITAIGETVDNDALKAIGLPVPGRYVKVNKKTNETEIPGVYLCGDALTGPLSIVGAMAGARKSVDHILSQREVVLTQLIAEPLSAEETDDLRTRKSVILDSGDNQDKDFAAWAEKEASRCLQCDVICNKCVDVCPNRANVSIRTEKKEFSQETQILHIDAYCNECGNCAQFCPWDGRPYKDKLTVFSLKEDFENSNNNGFFVEGESVRLRLKGIILNLTWSHGELTGPIPAGTEGRKTAALIRTVLKEYPWYTRQVEK
ncbi:MAG: putative selenate reductase subunit YgfK [Spirochaetaceae bacterium 4572_59]|nr:MAG: putative selenate reductase subunit YgfK [Spirochaetaceae bacterium 4572_59]